jgi:hypothetical protein
VSVRRSLGLALALLAAFPGVAYASPGIDTSQAVSLVTGVSSLLLSAMLLLVVVQLRRVAEGSAIVEHITYVVSASLCLVAAVLVGWVDRFVYGLSTDVVRAGGDVLVMFSILFFAIYFTRVKRALSSFLTHMHADDVLAAANGADVEEDTVA